MKSLKKTIPIVKDLLIEHTDIKNRNMEIHTVILTEGTDLRFTPGKHNKVQIAIIKEFASRFAPGSKLLFVRDTVNKHSYIDIDLLKALRVPNKEENKLPDVILYDLQRQWLFLFEVGTSHGPVSSKRMKELDNMLVECKTGKIYVSAFSNFKEFNKHAENIAWNTEVWLMDFPEHMIHFNGDRFIGPR